MDTRQEIATKGSIKGWLNFEHTLAKEITDISKAVQERYKDDMKLQADMRCILQYADQVGGFADVIKKNVEELVGSLDPELVHNAA